MKEKQEDQIENEFEVLLYDEVYEYENKKNKKEININIYNYAEKKTEKYKLLNEEEEILLCKEEGLNEIRTKKENIEDEIKIKEIYKGEDSDSFYYINKKELKKKYLMRTDINEDNENIHAIIDNKNQKEMEKLYNEIQLKHPRKIVDGKITRYSLFSWSGFFCCNKPEYYSLGQAYVTYFNTIKLLIIFFLIIALTNAHLITLCRQFTSIYNFPDDDLLLKTTLGNTIIRYFNTTFKYFERGKNVNYYIDYIYDITVDCGDDIIEEFVAVQRLYDDYRIYNYVEGEFKKYYYTQDSQVEFLDRIYELNYFLKRNKNCTNKSNCKFEFSTWYYGNDEPFIEERERERFNYKCEYDIIADIYYYSCRKKVNDNNINVEEKENELKTSITVISLITLIIIILFYSLYKKSISREQKEFEKNKIFINNYTLVLHNLKINSIDYYQEISDLISFLNNLIKKYKHLFIYYHDNYKEITDLNVFDISISNVNGKKLDAFDKIQSLQNKIQDILNDNDTLKNKVKNNIREIYRSMHNIAINLSDKEEKKKEEENEDENNTIKEEIAPQPENEEEYNLERQIKIGNTKTEINENINKITIDITKLHKEYNLKKYANIYITFRNQLMPNLIYDIYNKGIIIRFFYYIFCQKRKLEKYYYKNQWLNFSLAKENPSDIKWENCYISPMKKFWRRFLSIFLSLGFIVGMAAIMIINKIGEDDYFFLFRLVIPQIITTFSSLVLSQLTKFEKYSSKSKEIFSDISKTFWLNFLFYLTIFCKNGNIDIFTYNHIEDYFIYNKAIILNVVTSIVTAQAMPLVFFIKTLLQRFGDSKYNNGKTTELKTKVKYEELYLGPEFPFQDRYSIILLNLSICLLYGSNCPVIYFFFVCFLILTFIVDKFLMIYYYKKPPLYGSLLSKKIKNYFFFCALLYFYGLFYNVSNPYIFNNELLKKNSEYERFSFKDSREIFSIIYYFLNPFSLLYLIICVTSEMENMSFKYFNFNSNILLVHFFILVLVFLNPISFIKKKIAPSKKLISYLNTPPIEIGTIYTVEELKKYYEIKKLQLINLINDCVNKENNLDNYSDLINNYMFVITYIKQNINNKIQKQDNINDLNLNNIKDELFPLKENRSIINVNRLHLTGDISYNQSFISKYEIYNNFSLVKNL